MRCKLPNLFYYIRRCTVLQAALILISIMLATGVFAQENDWLGDFRISLYGTGSGITEQEESSSFSEFVTTVSLNSPFRETDGIEYAVDLRTAAYSEDRDTRFSLYNAYAGYKTGEGKFLFRGGQMWINELGALGSVGGGHFQMRGPKTSAGSIRFGGFGGLEPEILDAGYVPNVTKFGGYFALDAGQGRNHVVGYVTLRNSGLTERSALVFNNYVPIQNQFYLYQFAEVDLTGPGGMGSGGLNYFFVNGRYAPRSRIIEVQALFHHGTSIDSRSITQDVIEGRPVPPSSLQGLLFESANFRVTAKTVRNVFVFGGFGSDRNNREEDRTDRVLYGFFTSDLLNSGVDLHFQGTRYSPSNSDSYDSWNFSAGRNFGSSFYFSGSYYSSVVLVRLVEGDGIRVEAGPRTGYWSLSGLYHLNRSISLLANFDYANGNEYSEKRFLGGITYRFHRR